jgi:hypothetical protein
MSLSFLASHPGVLPILDVLPIMRSLSRCFDQESLLDRLEYGLNVVRNISDYSLIFFAITAARLEDLILPFSNEEIDGVVNNLKSDKSPGPDSFNTDFMKQDFYDLCMGFLTMTYACKVQMGLILP